MSAALDPGGGVQVPRAARQRALWTTVTASVPVGDGRRVGLDVGTDRGEWHVSVLVARDERDRLTVATYPALTGPQASTSRAEPEPLTPASDPALETTARRVVRNYLERAQENLGADLAPGATVVLPDQRLRVRSIGEIGWTAQPRVLRVEVAVRQTDGVGLTLAYDLHVTRRAGRWLVRDLLSTPTQKERP